MMWIPQTALKAAVACLALAAALAACNDDGGSPPLAGPALRILAGAGITDTISTAPVQGLVVQVLGEDGRPDAGVEVRFEVPQSGDPTAHRLAVSAVTASSFSLVAGATTDEKGRATVRVRLGSLAGPAGVVITVPLYDLADTAEYTVLPGNPAKVSLEPRDTLLMSGASFTYRGGSVDRRGNAREDPVSYLVRGTAVTVDGTGRATAREPGSAVVRIEAAVGSAMVADSAVVTVVPAGRLAWTGPNGSLALSDMTGEDITTLVASRALAPAWAPGRDRLVYARADGRLSLVDLSGYLTEVPTPGVREASWPEFSRDGEWIYFHAIPEGVAGTRIFRIRPDGTGMEQLSPTTEDARTPTPSPDGKRRA